MSHESINAVGRIFFLTKQVNTKSKESSKAQVKVSAFVLSTKQVMVIWLQDLHLIRLLILIWPHLLVSALAKSTKSKRLIDLLLQIK